MKRDKRRKVVEEVMNFVDVYNVVVSNFNDMFCVCDEGMWYGYRLQNVLLRSPSFWAFLDLKMGFDI